MRKINPSIRTQLLLWLVIPILVLLLCGACLAYGVALSLTTEAYDKALLDSVYSVAACVKLRGDQVIIDLPPPALAILLEGIKERTYYQVRDQSGRIIAGNTTISIPTRSPTFREGEKPNPKSAEYRNSSINGDGVRIASMNFPLSSKPNRSVTIQVAETMHSREQIADRILIGVVALVFSMVAISALVVGLGVARGLAPLKSIRDAIASRTPFDLRPIDVANVPKEVRPLVNAIDGLLLRLREDIEAQKRFVANAAHQLRTPIAGLKTQSELALRQENPDDVRHALRLIYLGAERSGRLANQLLSLARAEPGAVDVNMWQFVDLNLVAKEASKELVAHALSKNIDIGFEGTEKPAMIRGDQASLYELASNLIENAILYTHAGGQVTVRVCQENINGVPGSIAEWKNHRDNSACIKLVVEDNGPGIPKEERGKVFERFYRISDRGVNGSGLGLSIVREIASVHGAQVSLTDDGYGCGTRVVVNFPWNNSSYSSSQKLV